MEIIRTRKKGTAVARHMPSLAVERSWSCSDDFDSDEALELESVVGSRVMGRIRKLNSVPEPKHLNLINCTSTGNGVLAPSSELGWCLPSIAHVQCWVHKRLRPVLLVK